MAHYFKSFTHSISGATVTIRNQTGGSGENASFGDSKILISQDSNDPNQEDYTYTPASGEPINGSLHFYVDTSAEPPKLMASTSRNGSYSSKGELTTGGDDYGFILQTGGGGIVIFGTTDPTGGGEDRNN